MSRRSSLIASGFTLLVALILIISISPRTFSNRAFSLTGEESLGGQLRGLWQLAGDALRPPLDLRPDVPIANAGVNPYGINIFLEQEVEPAKRAEQVRLISAAGFHWLRQEFPWYDIEIHTKGDFEDRRFEPYRSAWNKYDHIVSLAEEHNMELIVRLSSPPAWSRAAGDTHGAFAPPDSYTDFADYAAAVASRYAGRVSHFQVWNEPNIFPEWGEQDVDPEAYTQLLCIAYSAIKAANPQAIVLAGALAPTADLTGRDLNDFIFLERMYIAGAGECFDIMSVQGYGLWSGPTDQRMRPVVINFARNQFIRDMMVQNGHADKAIWISEMNWNAVPPESGLPPLYGQVSLAQQARWAPLAYERAQQDWPWIGVVNFWFFKRATDAEQSQSWYYFRMAEPDFTLLPVYDSMKAHVESNPPSMYPGLHQEDHWAIQVEGVWERIPSESAQLGAYAVIESESAINIDWHGTDLLLIAAPNIPGGDLTIRIDDRPPQSITLPRSGGLVPVAERLSNGRHRLTIEVDSALALDAIQVRARAPISIPMLLVVFAVLGTTWFVNRNSLDV